MVNGTNNIQEKSEENIMKKLTFNKKGVTHHPLKSWELSNGTTVAIYQGERGANPDLDFVLKYLAPNKRLRAISHTHWIVDLLIKSFSNNINVDEFIGKWLSLYDQIEPFQSVDERNNYELLYTEEFTSSYDIALNQHGTYRVDFLSTIIELFIKCEKQTPNAFMFKGLLRLMKDFTEGKKDFYQIISYSKRV
jgi:hypothetical protein